MFVGGVRKMKHKLLLFLFLISAIFSQAQLRKVPSHVADALHKRYPHAEKVEWQDNITAFEAEFYLNGHKISSSFNKHGDWMSTERKIEFDQLPILVQEGFHQSKYRGWKKTNIIEINRIRENLQYKISIRKSEVQKKHLYFDTNGKLIKEAIHL